MSRRLRSITDPDALPGYRDNDRASARIEFLREALPPGEDVERVAAVFRLMGDPGRVRILATLLEAGEVCVHDLASVAGLSESSVSQALRLMRAHRVVETRRAGRVVFYRLGDNHVRMLLDLAITHAGHSPAVTAVSSPIDPTRQEPT
ncbi:MULTISPECIES: ArsR/SmtB family transcription factor [Micrococcaceae]|jgi:DNA-binding transcriptional ArsR family regulator|uniref:DNA-binding transcriptional ArsR family regulator n=1 Tax=Pseudarthrobacter enclensis TaxID=993070 RepID=A0ABT9S0H4_9MICC|nr:MULTISPECIES: metalloregulator ArsR/SmtB family transcription factor [Micrococcaceae]MDP9890393.1 DNA-binding transcriptional ArsR family regulator [Pseudarthrobacter enclensis]UKA73485.1 metalloregulator ArsR/SmtB family transcription factor [Arthrobacter sp. FW306-06-A]WJH26678.1 helix-turn-helix transcriptional regulator [Pseudarthrobacter defluvii]